MKYLICASIMPAEVEKELPGASPAAGGFIRSLEAGIKKRGFEVQECSYIALKGAEESFDKHSLSVKNVVFKNKTIIQSVNRFKRMVLKNTEKDDVILFYNCDYYDFGLVEKLKKKGAIPLLILADYTESNEVKRNFLRKIIIKQQKKEFAKFDYAVILSDEARRFFNSTAKILVMEGGIVPERFKDITLAGKEKTTRFLYAGTLSNVTGVDLLLEAMSKIDDPDIELVISGKGELTEEVVTASKKDSRIKYMGFMDEKQYLIALNSAHVFINPRNMTLPQNRNNFPSKVLEYLACGRPVISTKFPGYTKFAENFIFCDDGIESLANCISDTCNLNDSDYVEYYRKNRKKSYDYSWDNQAEKIIDLIRPTNG